MATKKRRTSTSSQLKKVANNTATSSLLIVPPIPKGEVMVLDEEELPIMGNFGRSVEITYPKEFAIMDSMAVNQSAVFLQGKTNIITAIRTRIQKLSAKKFVVKKINTTHCRLWRVPDNQVTRFGGRQATAKAAQNYGKVKGKHGGYRGPKQTHKDGTPIVPASELNHVES